MTLRISTASALLSVSLLAACSPPASTKTETSTTTQTTVVRSAARPTTVAVTEPVSCAAQIGVEAAQARADVCRNASPATHPPCNPANSCAMIEDEIARSCALFPDKTAASAECTPAPMSSQAAAAVVTRYYSALNARDYDTAWRQWGEDGPPNQTRDKFQIGFAHTASTQVTIGKLEPAEGAAGSIYQTVPVTIDATLDTGERQRFTGDYVVRRVNGVDGASAEQLRWHIDAAHLKAVAAD